MWTSSDRYMYVQFTSCVQGETCSYFTEILVCAQPAITCLKLTIKTLEQDVKYVQS